MKPFRHSCRYYYHFLVPRRISEVSAVGKLSDSLNTQPLLTPSFTRESSFKIQVLWFILSFQNKADASTNHEDEAFELLFSHVALQLFSEAQQAEDVLKVRSCSSYSLGRECSCADSETDENEEKGCGSCGS